MSGDTHMHVYLNCYSHDILKCIKCMSTYREMGYLGFNPNPSLVSYFAKIQTKIFSSLWGQPTSWRLQSSPRLASLRLNFHILYFVHLVNVKESYISTSLMYDDLNLKVISFKCLSYICHESKENSQFEC